MSGRTRRVDMQFAADCFELGGLSGASALTGLLMYRVVIAGLAPMPFLLLVFVACLCYRRARQIINRY